MTASAKYWPIVLAGLFICQVYGTFLHTRVHTVVNVLSIASLKRFVDVINRCLLYLYRNFTSQEAVGHNQRVGRLSM